VDIQYDAANRRTLLTLPNGANTEYQYDVASRLTALIYRNALGPLGDLQYGYDAAGNRISVGGSFARTLLPVAVASATYDQGNRRLTFGPSTMTFDDNGNLLTKTDPSGTMTYTWDARNRLTGMAGPSASASFAYDALGRRARTTIDSGLIEFQYDRLDIVKETGGTEDVSYLRTLGIDETLTRLDTVDTHHFLADALGSTVVLTDSSGAPATTYTYEPYGRAEVAGTLSPNPFQFTGRANDGAGLYHYRARYYHPTLARFVSQDPLSLVGSLHLYAYASSNPMRYVDPWGLFTMAVGGQATAGAGVGYSLSASLAGDSQGNVGSTETAGAGGMAGYGASAGIQVQVTSASSLDALQGWSVESGGSVTIAGVNIGLEWIVGEDGRYHGLNVNVGWGAGPLSAEVHSFATHTWVQKFFNLYDLRNHVNQVNERIGPDPPRRK
jgi:RHS repeat-associated protein